MTDEPAVKSDLKSRLVTEMKKYLFVSGYLFICFAVILFYEASLAPGKEATLLVHGLALGKALVIGKFILIGDALEAGTRVASPTLLHRVLYRCSGMLIVLLVLKLVEEWIIGLVHGESFAAVLGKLLEQPWVNLLAPVLLMLLILIPLITATELDRALGKDGLKRVLLARASD